MTKLVELHEKPVYSEELFQSFYPMICKMIHQTTYKLSHNSDNLDRFEDYVQMCRIWLWEHCDKYNPERLSKDGRTCKFSTYMQMVFYSRLGAIRNNKNKKKQKNVCVDFSNFHSNQMEFEDSGDYTTDISYLMDTDSRVNDYENQFDLNQTLSNIRESLTEQKYKIYEEYFIEGRASVKQIAEHHPDLKYNQITKILKELKEIHSKFIGEKENVKSRKQVCSVIQSGDDADSAFSEDNAGDADEFTEQSSFSWEVDSLPELVF